MLGSNFKMSGVEHLDSTPPLQNKVVISILFTGTVFGEYLLVMDEKVAATLLPDGRDAISEAFSEMLNIIVGESVVELTSTFKKLTITAPKVLFGSANYPKVKSCRSTLSSDAGAIDCYLYVDRMNLDIASSYKEAMSSLFKANEELKAAFEKLKEQQAVVIQAEKMGALGTMAAGVAHEINTPLATISLLGGQIKETIVQPEPYARENLVDMLDTIEKTIKRISTITNSLRTFAAGIYGEKIATKKITDIVNQAVLLSDELLRQKGVKMQLEINTQTEIECRPTEICQILLNLITNACDAISAQENKWIKIQVQEEGDFLSIRCTDAGKITSKDVQKKLFDPFFTTKELNDGKGLGLSVAKGIADSHSGTLGLDPNHKNTSFVLRLPRLLKKSA